MTLRRLPSIAAVAFAATACAFLIASGPVRAAVCANVEVQNVRPGQGMLMVAAFSDAESYGKTPVVALQMRAGDATMTFPLCGLEGTAVALKLFQDVNGNGKLDTNILGMPSEPWGASGTPPAMSAPTWPSTVVPLDGSTIVVKLSK